MDLTGHGLREEGIIDICFIAALMGIFNQEAPLGPPGGGSTEQGQASEPSPRHPIPWPVLPSAAPCPSSGSQGPPSIPPLGVPAPAPPLLPVAQDLGVGRGLTGKDDALALLHRLGLYRQGHCRGVCKAEDGRSGPFLSLTFLFLSLAHTLRPHPCGDLGI